MTSKTKSRMVSMGGAKEGIGTTMEVDRVEGCTVSVAASAVK
jgi:hypothetical protein